ncbi:MAG: XRE family transcriptional regulator [Thermomicrobiales bacterium]
MQISTPIQQAHRNATTASIGEVAGFLQELLTRRLTAYIAGVKDAKTVTRWVTGEITDIRSTEVEQRLRGAYEIAQLLLQVESAQTTRAWFIGMNPQLDDISPAEAIRNGDLRDALAASRAFLVGG